MRILITGAQGQVGSEFECLDLPNDIEVICLGRSELDIADPDLIARAFATHRPDLLINTAAYTAVDQAESEPDMAFKINEIAVGLLADACVVAQIPMFHVSTDYVFDGEKFEAYTEDDPVNPISVYGKSKEAGERALRDKLDRHLILRTSWVFGSNGANFVKTIVRLAKQRGQVFVVNDQIGGPTSASAIARCLIILALRYKENYSLEWGTYHFSQLPYVSWHEFASQAIALAYDLRIIEHLVTVTSISSNEFPTQASRPKNSRLSVDEIKRVVPDGGIYDWSVDLEDVVGKLGG